MKLKIFLFHPTQIMQSILNKNIFFHWKINHINRNEKSWRQLAISWDPSFYYTAFSFPLPNIWLIVEKVLRGYFLRKRSWAQNFSHTSDPFYNIYIYIHKYQNSATLSWMSNEISIVEGWGYKIIGRAAVGYYKLKAKEDEKSRRWSIW